MVRKKRRYTETHCPDSTGECESCETSFELIDVRVGDTSDISLIRAFPRSGRTHQIRATLFSSGFPLVGDKLYGLDEGMFLRQAAGALDGTDARRLLLPGQALHCAELSLLDAAGRAICARSAPPWISFPGGGMRP
jgi:23S rRNA pseudouridine1911/1915/1917 synthase